MSERAVRISVLVPLSSASEDVAGMHAEIVARLDELSSAYEMIYLVSGSSKEAVEPVRALYQREPERVRVLQFADRTGESAMLTAGVERARGEILLTLPARLETDLSELSRSSKPYTPAKTSVLSLSVKISAPVPKFTVSMPSRVTTARGPTHTVS